VEPATANYSFWALIAGAGPVVKGVMLLLLAASLASWVVIFVKARQLQVFRRKEAAFNGLFQHADSLSQLMDDLNQDRQAASSASAAVFRSGYRQYKQLVGLQQAADLVRTCRRAMGVMIAKEADQLDRFTPFLAIVASAAPFLGLFGTVWGIMNSFRTIGAVGQATLAVVAPGIAEALVATAAGLAAAIPAVVAYNLFTRFADRQHGQMDNLAESLTTMIEQQVQSG
jgi:biopolymer transport protein TolQ